MLKNKIHIASFSWTNFVQIVFIVILSVLLLNQCNVTAQKEKAYQQNLEAKNDSIEFYQNKQGLWVAEKKAFQTTVKEMDRLIDDYLFDNSQLKETIKSFKTPKSAHSSDIKVEVKDVDVKFANPIPFSFEREFKKATNNYGISGLVNQYGLKLNFIATTQLTLATGIKKTGLFTSDFTSEATLSNSNFSISNMDNIDFTEKQSRFALSLFGGYVIPANLNPTFAVGIGISYDVVRF